MLNEWMDPKRWLRDARRMIAQVPSLRVIRVPDAPILPVRDCWPGNPAAGARLLKGELEVGGVVRPLVPGLWEELDSTEFVLAAAHSFTWLRELRALGTDAARLRARALVADWLAATPGKSLASRPDVTGARIAAWLGHYDFFAASADDAFRQNLMSRLLADTRSLSAALPCETLDARSFTALKGLTAAAVALPDQTALLTRALRFLPQEIERQILSDGGHRERSPSVHLAVLQNLIEIRAFLHAAQVPAPPALGPTIEKLAGALRVFRHGDGGLALFNGSKEEASNLIDLVLTQAGRTGRAPAGLPESGFQRLQAGRSVLILDGGAPPPPGYNRFSHAGALSFEFSVGRDRLVVNCGSAPEATGEWRDALRGTAAHSTLVIADTNSAELRPDGLGRRPERVEIQRQEANGAHWMEASHDGWLKPFGAIHRRRLYLAESGEDLRGEDTVEAPSPQPFVVRFHMHPSVRASLQQDGEGVLLRLTSGAGWRFRAEGAKLTLEEGVYFGENEIRRSELVALTSFPDGPQTVKWAITRMG